MTKKIFIIILITIFTFFFIDLLFGKYFYKKYIRKNYIKADTSFGEKDFFYHHRFKKNYESKNVSWGKIRYNLCTDSNRFRSSCNQDLNENHAFFDIVFIGDSQTESVGINFEDSFVGIISKQLKEKKIANLAMSAYSPAIYFAKLNYFISQGYKFKEVVVFVDISDLYDEVNCYKLEGDLVLDKNIYTNCFETRFNFKENILNFLKNKFTLTSNGISIFRSTLENYKLIEKKIDSWILNNERSNWTFNYKKKDFNNLNKEDALKIYALNMLKLHKLLNENDIKLSIAVYPWPATLKYDSERNQQLVFWEDFCHNRCYNFFNLMEPFFKLKNQIGFDKLYFLTYIDGDIHFNENGNKIIAESFLRSYYNNKD